MKFLNVLLAPRTLLTIGSSLGLLLVVAIIFYAADRNPGLPDSALLFIGLVITLLIGLVMAAALYRGMGYNQLGADAFGLPNGSMRALLGIALMSLLVVFGLPFLHPDTAPLTIADQPLATVKIGCDEIAGEVAQYRRQGLIAVPDVGACVATGAEGAANAAPRLGVISIFRLTHEWPGPQLELNKQTLTAIITLLTTIIGFYFGSASTTAGQAKLMEKITGVDPAVNPIKSQATSNIQQNQATGDSNSFQLF